ncbi:uncharacterized protein LOC114830232 [Esox lucius]|uniref:uncharacterized protein LOC114830232 n=1 Tax=Esox lucius TaxID=8010 RepID=UPI00147722E4|nr:uncharacterized protein LOC114830232 [Esox lucius]
MMTSQLSLHSIFLLVCLVLSAVDESCSYPSSARSRKTVQEERISLETEEPRNWRLPFYPFTPNLSLSPSQSFPNHIQRDQAQRVFTLRRGAKSGTKLTEVLFDGENLEPVNSGQQGMVQSVRGDYVQKEIHHPQRRTVFRVSSKNLDKSNSPAILSDDLPHKHFPGDVSSNDAFNRPPFHPSAPQRENGLETADPQESDQLYIQEPNSVRAVVKPIPVPITSQPFSDSPISFRRGTFSSTSEPIKVARYHSTYSLSDLGSPIVPGTLGTSGNFQPVKTPVIQGGNVVTNSLHPAGERRGSPVADHPHIQIQWSENPLSKTAIEGEKSVNTLADTSPTQSERNPSVGESGLSTNVKGDYGQTGSMGYPRSFKSGNRQQAPEHQSAVSQSASLEESELTPSVTQPFHRSANFAHTGGLPGNYSSNKIAGPQARSAFSRFLPGSRFGFFWNALTKPMQNMPPKRKTAPSILAPNQSRTKSRPVSWGNSLVLRNSSSSLTRGPTGNYKLGKSTSINTLFGFKGFQYQAPKILASIKSEEDHPVLVVRDSINTNHANNQYIGWRESLGTSRGINMGSVSRYPPVLKKYGFRPINKEVPISDSPVPSIILTTATFSSEPQKVQSMSVEDSLVSRNTESAHGDSDHRNVQGSLDVVKSDTDSVYVNHSSDSPAPRQHVSSTQNTIPDSITSTAFKPEVRFKKFEFVMNKESNGFRNKQNRSSLDIKSAGETKPSVRQVEPTPPEIQPTSITTTATQSLYVHSGGPSGDTSHKTGDDKSYDENKSTAQYTETEKLLSKHFRYKSGALSKRPNGYADMGLQILKNKAGTTPDKDADLRGPTVSPITEVLPLSGSKGDPIEHPPRGAFSYSANVHLGPANVHTGPANVHTGPANVHTGPANVHTGPANVHTGPANVHSGPANVHSGPANVHSGPANVHSGPANVHSGPANVHSGPANVHMGPVRVQVLPRSRNPTGRVVKGKTFKENVPSSSVALSPPNNAASPSVLRLGEHGPMRFKAVQFDDILGSASFSGVRQSGGSRPTVQPTANTFTTVSSHGGGARDRWLGSTQGKGGKPRDVPLPPVPSNKDAGQSGEGHASNVQENVRSMEGYFGSIKGGMGRKENPSRSYVSSVGSADNPSGNPSQSEDLSEMNYLRTSAGNLFFKSIKSALTA